MAGAARAMQPGPGTTAMVDREKVTAVLLKRFPGASPRDIAAAANAIVGLYPEYEPIDPTLVSGFHCATDASHYRLVDVLSGRVKLLRRLPGDD